MTNDSIQISDCTGGHGMMQFDSASQNYKSIIVIR